MGTTFNVSGLKLKVALSEGPDGRGQRSEAKHRKVGAKSGECRMRGGLTPNSL